MGYFCHRVQAGVSEDRRGVQTVWQSQYRPEDQAADRPRQPQLSRLCRRRSLLTGALKLFFRELKEPLIPWEAVEKLLSAINLPSKKTKLRTIKEIVGRLAPTHLSTLIFLLKHLEKVTQYKDVNRMASANLAIVFGPTLMWPPAHLTTTNMALNMMQQNMIVEALITNLGMIS